MVKRVRYDPFFLLSDAELEDMIRDLARQLGTNAQQIASPEAGSVTYESRADADKRMQSLQDSYFRRKGMKLDVGRIRFITVVPTYPGSCA